MRYWWRDEAGRWTAVSLMKDERKNKSWGAVQPKRSKWKCEKGWSLQFRWLAGGADRGHTAGCRLECCVGENWGPGRRHEKGSGGCSQWPIGPVWNLFGVMEGSPEEDILCVHLFIQQCSPKSSLESWVPDPGLCGWKAMGLSEFITLRALSLVELITGIDGFERSFWGNK